jgi:NAD(P)-dependent dehydrogenase (short-subunit alcohol dehydrogenase family)
VATAGQLKVAFVTGAGSGLGRATAKAFVTKGYATLLADRDETNGRKVEAELRQHGECLFVACDVTNDESVRHAVAQAVEKFGRLDAAFNAAGVDGEHGHMTAECTLENWHHVLNVDLTGTFHCLRHQIPELQKSGGGSIVNCASVAGIRGAPTFAAYSAAKHGVVGLTRAAALEYARQNIRVNAICPGTINTPMNQGLDQELLKNLVESSPAGRLGLPEEIAATVLWLCDDQAAFVNGQAIAVDGAWTAR